MRPVEPPVDCLSALASGAGAAWVNVVGVRVRQMVAALRGEGGRAAGVRREVGAREDAQDDGAAGDANNTTSFRQRRADVDERAARARGPWRERPGADRVAQRPAALLVQRGGVSPGAVESYAVLPVGKAELADPHPRVERNPIRVR